MLVTALKLIQEKTNSKAKANFRAIQQEQRDPADYKKLLNHIMYQGGPAVFSDNK